MARLLWATGLPFPSRGGSQVGGCAVVEVRRNWTEIVDLVQCRRAKLWGRCGAEGKWERCPSRPDCTQLSANGCRCQPARRGESQGRGWLSDLQIDNFRGVGGVDHAPSGRGWRMARMKGMRIRRDADADHATWRWHQLRIRFGCGLAAASKHLRAQMQTGCRLADDKGHGLRGFSFSTSPPRNLSRLSASPRLALLPFMTISTSGVFNM